MVNRRLKQIVALLIIIGFAGSIFFFLPKTPNNTPVSYYIIVPQPLINKTLQTDYSTLSINSGQVDSVIGQAPGVQVSTLVSIDNITNMLQFTESMLKSVNMSYTVSGGSISCVSSPIFTKDLCANASLSQSWVLFKEGAGGKLIAQTVPLSSIALNSIYSNTTFILAFFSNVNSSVSTPVNVTYPG